MYGVREYEKDFTAANMTSFLFWNMSKKPLEHLLAAAAHERDIDVILLAECTNPENVLVALNSFGEDRERLYNYQPEPVGRVRIFSLLPRGSIIPLGENSGLTFLRLRPPIGSEMLLIGAHLPSKLHLTYTDQTLLGTEWARAIQEFEVQVGHQRTVIVGDLNMSPFEPGVVAAQGFHAASSRRIAARGRREVQGREYPFFYNPMWNHFGDKARAHQARTIMTALRHLSFSGICLIKCSSDLSYWQDFRTRAWK